jgi:hypothetical protein
MNKEYEMPELVFVGVANEVVQGPPGGGFDGDYGFDAMDFERARLAFGRTVKSLIC